MSPLVQLGLKFRQSVLEAAERYTQHPTSAAAGQARAVASPNCTRSLTSFNLHLPGQLVGEAATERVESTVTNALPSLDTAPRDQLIQICIKDECDIGSGVGRSDRTRFRRGVATLGVHRATSRYVIGAAGTSVPMGAGGAVAGSPVIAEARSSAMPIVTAQRPIGPCWAEDDLLLSHKDDNSDAEGSCAQEAEPPSGASIASVVVPAFASMLASALLTQCTPSRSHNVVSVRILCWCFSTQTKNLATW